jgi:hypothetical protein
VLVVLWSGRAARRAVVEAGHEATTAPASSSTWKAIAGKRARATARRRTGSRSGVPWRGPCCGGARSPAVRPGLPSSRSVKLASKRRRRQCRAVPGRRSPASGPGRRRDGAPAADRACRGLVVVSGGWQAAVAGVCSCWRCCGQWRAAHRAAPGRRSPASEPGRRPDGTPAADRACRGLVVVSGGWQAAVAGVCSCWRCCGQWRAAHRAAPGRRSPASEPGRRPDGTPAADRACRGLVRISGCSITGSASGSSFSRSVKPATKRRRRQCRAVPGGDRRQAGHGDGETAYRQPIGRAVAWSGSRAVLDRRQCFRVFVLSIVEAGHEATTAPASSSTWKAIAGKRARATARRRTGSRSGVPWRGPCCGGARSPAVRPGLPSSRSVKLASKRRRRQCRAVPGRRSPASGPGRRPDGTPAADRACRGLVKVSVCWQASVAGVCQGSRRRGSCWWCCGQGVQLVGQCFRVFVLSIGETCHEATTAPMSNGAWKAIAGKRARATARRRTGSRSGLPWRGRGVGWLASRGCRRVLVLAVLWSVACSSSSSTGKAIAGKRCRDDGETAHRQPIGVAAAWSSCRSAGRHRLPACARVAAGVARAGGA